MQKYIKLFLLLFVLTVLVSACALDKQTEKEQINREIKSLSENKQQPNKNIDNKAAIETAYHYFFVKFFKNEELTPAEEKRYEKDSGEIMSILGNSEKINSQCLEEGSLIDKQFTDKSLGQDSIFYNDSGVVGLKYNLRLLQAIRSYSNCINDKAANIKEVTIYNHFISGALFAEFNAGCRILYEKENNQEICKIADLQTEQQSICELIDENYLINQVEKANGLISIIKTKEEIKKQIEQFKNFTALIKD
jgi:hypothetical protein